MTEDANGLSREQKERLLVAVWAEDPGPAIIATVAAMLAEAEKRGEDRGRAEAAAAAWEAVAAEIVAAGEAGRAEGRRDALAAYVGTAAQEGTTEARGASGGSAGGSEAERPSDGRTGPPLTDSARRGPRLDECGARQAGMVCRLKRGHDGAHEDYSGTSGVPAPMWIDV